MRRLALSTFAIISLFSLSACGMNDALEGLTGSKETTTSQAAETTSNAASSEKSKSSSTKESTAKSSTAKKSNAAKDDAKTAEPSAEDGAEKPYSKEIPADQQEILKKALVPIIKEYAENPESDTVTGQIRFDKNMKPINFSKFTVNDKPIGIDGPVRREAEQALQPLADIPASERFSKLEFDYANNYLKATVYYRD